MNSIAAVLVALQARFVRTDERGATATEYALLVAMIALAITGAVGLFGTALAAYFGRIVASAASW